MTRLSIVVPCFNEEGCLSELHQRLFGPQVGIWRVLSLVERYEIPATFYIPSYTAMRHPDVVAVAGSNTPTATHHSRRSSGFKLPGPHDFPPPVLP